jgi:hypothetical protein
MNKLKWFGTVTSVAGSFLVSFSILIPGYWCFMLGSVSWTVIGAVNRDKPLLTLNSIFLLANLIGLFNAVV